MPTSFCLRDRDDTAGVRFGVIVSIPQFRPRLHRPLRTAMSTDFNRVRSVNVRRILTSGCMRECGARAQATAGSSRLNQIAGVGSACVVRFAADGRLIDHPECGFSGCRLSQSSDPASGSSVVKSKRHHSFAGIRAQYIFAKECNSVRGLHPLPRVDRAGNELHLAFNNTALDGAYAPEVISPDLEHDFSSDP
jgi:hypothetical protein